MNTAHSNETRGDLQSSHYATLTMSNERDDDDGPRLDAAGHTLRGRGGDAVGQDRGTERGGVFETVAAATGRALPDNGKGALASVEGWVLMLSNLSPSATDNDVKLLLSDVDPTDPLSATAGDANGSSAKSFIADFRMNPAAATCACNGHAFVKVATLDHAYLVQSLNGTKFVDDMPLRVDFAFAVPPPRDPSAAAGRATATAAGRYRPRAGADDAGPSVPDFGRETVA